MNANIYAQALSAKIQKLSQDDEASHNCVYIICTYTYMHTYIHTQTNIYIYTHIHEHTYIYMHRR